MKHTVSIHICCLLFLMFRLESVHCHGNHRHHSDVLSSKNIKIAHSNANEQHNHSGEIPDHRFFLTELFAKYGHGGVMTFEGFEHLLENLNLGGIVIKDHDLSSHRDKGNEFKNNHPHHEHKQSSFDQEETGTIASTVPIRQENTYPQTTHDHHDHEHDHHEVQKHSHPHDEHVTKGSENSNNKSGAGVWHYMPEYLNNLTSLFLQHHEYVNQGDNVVVIKEQGCLSASEILKTFDINNKISPMGFLHLCPAIIYELDQRHCIDATDYYKTSSEVSMSDVWLYSSLAVLAISLCGLLSVAVIPIMQKVFYQTLLQFLVGLAIGSLSGDALLHLLPHALTLKDDHDHSEEANREEEAMVWRGLAALAGVYVFFLAERLLNATASYRQKKKSAKESHLSKLKMETNTEEKQKVLIGEKLSDYRKSSYKNGSEDKEMLQMLSDRTTEDKLLGKLQLQQTYTPVPVEENTDQNHEKVTQIETIVYNQGENDQSYFIQMSDHNHGHGHSHELPSSISAVALMVIMGDGLHNFCDGLAIGAAFAANISGGFSTSVAVFCHELPHELGDFAMLLKTGMSAKQALFYNGLSSILCFIGMAIGVALGNLTSATKWVFAGTAGMFLYIALVDMLPELETSKNSSRRLAIQFLGISLGISIMLFIAIYEHDLKHMMS